MRSKYAHLLSPGKIGAMEVKNRIVMSPMVRKLRPRPTESLPKSLIDHYAARAKGGRRAYYR